MKTVLAIFATPEMKDHFVRALDRNYTLYFCDATENTAVLKKIHADALVLELCLSDCTGFDILERNRQFLPPVVLALTTVASRPVMEEAAAAGVTCLIRLPCTGREVSSRLENMIKKDPSLSGGEGLSEDNSV